MRAVFLNQLIAIESEQQPDGSGLLTLTSPVNETNYMDRLLNAVQDWQPRNEGNPPIATDARIENNQVICSLIPQTGGIDTERLNAVILPSLVTHLEQGTTRAMSASATGTTTGEEDYETMRGT